MIKYDIQETLHFQKRGKMGPLFRCFLQVDRISSMAPSSWKAMSSWGLKHPRHGAMTYLVKKTLRSAGESSMPNHFENIRAIHCY